MLDSVPVASDPLMHVELEGQQQEMPDSCPAHSREEDRPAVAAHQRRHRLAVPFAAFVFLATGIAASGYRVFEHEKHQIRGAYESELTAIADSKAAEVGLWLAERRIDGERLHDSPLLAAAVRNMVERPGHIPPEDVRLLEQEIALLQRAEHYSAAQLISRDGKSLVPPSAGGSSPTNDELAFALTALRSNSVSLSEFHRGADGRTAIDMAVPISGGAPSPLAVLLLHIDPYEALYPLIESWPVPRATAETVLVARDGDAATHLNDLRHGAYPALSVRIPLTQLQSPGVQAVLGREGIFDGVDYRGKAVATALRPVPGSPWTVVAKVDTVEIDGPVRRVFAGVALVTLLLLFGSALACLVWWRREQAAQQGREDHLQRLRIDERAKEELQWAALFNAIHHPLFVHDQNLRIVRANRAYLRQASATLQEVLGKPYWQVFPRLEGPLASCREAMQGKPGGKTDEIRLPGGEIFLSRSYAAFDDTGGHISSIHILEDITEQQKTKHMLQRSEAHFHTLASASPAGIFRTDAGGSYTYVNPGWAEITGIPASRALGQGWLDAFPSGERERIAADWAGIVARGDSLQVEHKFELADGGYRWVMVQALPERGEGGRVLGYVGTVTDVSAQKAAELEALQMNELYALLSAANESMVRAENRQRLFDDTCRIAIDFGHLTSACVSLVETGHAAAQVVARAGRPGSTDEPGPFPRQAADGGLMAIAIRNGAPEVSTRLTCEGCNAPAASAAVFPLYCRGAVIGAIGLQAERPDYFTKERVELLVRLAADLSYALDKLALEDERRASEEKLRLNALVFEVGDQAITICDADKRIVSVNRAFTAITGYTLAEVAGREPRLLSSGRHDSAFYQAMWSSIHATGHWEGEIWNRRRDGEMYAEWLSISVARNAEGGVTHYIGVFSDISARKKAESQIEFLSRFDALTELPNRILLIDRMEQAIAQSRRSQLETAVLYLDLDRFKQVNNTLGLACGDALLKAIAERFRDSLRETDTIARLGGDEFVIVLPGIARQQDVSATAKKVLALLERPFFIRDQELFASASIGIALYPRDGEDARTVLKNAAAAMNRVKEEGRGHFQFYAEEMNARAVERLALENSLRRAIEREEFLLHFQPKVDVGSGRVAGAEALVRWQHPDLGIVPPASFIPMAEETGMIVPLGQWILRRACMQAVIWRGGISPDLKMAVNVSPRQFRQPDFVQTVVTTLQETGLDPTALVLEITEGLLIHEPDKVAAALRDLRAMGIRFSVDDFGTGYASLGYLKRFPIDELKIDPTFVREIVSDAEDSAITRAIITMAHALNLRVVAEGVETDAQTNLLRRNRCDELQGYFFSAPIPADEFDALLMRAPLLDAPQAPEKRTLLVLDDEPNVLSAIRRALRSEGYEVLTASNPQDAFELLALHHVQVLLCDQRMPGMSGTEFLGRAKEMYPDTVRIVLSGYTELKAVTDAINRGAIYKFLTKPWEDDLLRENIKDAFWRYEERKQPNAGTD